MGLIKADTIIISRTDKLGDFIVSIPSYATCRAMFPQSKIIALTSKYNADIARTLDSIDEVISVDDYENIQDLIDKLRSCNPDVFVALKSDNVISKLATKSGAKVRIGPLSKPLSFFSYNYGIRQSRSKSIKSEAEYNLDLICEINPNRFEAVGIQRERIKYSEEDKQKALAYLEKEGLLDKNFIAFFPVPGGSNVNFRPSGYAKFINYIMENAEKYNHPHGNDNHSENADSESKKRHSIPSFVLVGQPSAQSKFEEIKSFVTDEYKSAVHFFLNNESILVAAALIDNCKCCLGPSTGTVHIAGNFDKSAVVFYGTARSRCHTRWELYGDANEVPFTIPDDAITDNEHIDNLSKMTFDAMALTLLEEFYRY